MLRTRPIGRAGRLRPFSAHGAAVLLVASWSLCAAARASAADALRIKSFAPTDGPPGASVVLSGTGFSRANAVEFNGVAASFRVDSAKQVTATVPAAAKTGRIVVRRPGGTAASGADFTVAGPVEATTTWSMLQHDPQHTGKASTSGPATSAVHAAWVYKAVSWIKNEPSIGPDGTVYIGDSRFPLCALDPGAGTQRWCTDVGGYVDQSSPTVGNPFAKTDGQGTRTVQTIYMGDRNNVFWAIDSEGEPLWHYKIPLDGDVRASAIIGPAPAHTVYAMCGCTTRGVVHAFSPDGTLLWVVDLPQTRQSSPAAIQFGAHFRLYVVTNNGLLHAIDDLGASGSIAWTLALGVDTSHGSPSIGADGTIYVGTAAGLFAVKDNGASAQILAGWPFPTAGEVDTTAAIRGGKLYVSSEALGVRTLYAIDATQSPPAKLWSFTGPGSSSASFSLTPSAVIGANGLVYAAIGSDVYGFDPAAANPANPRWHFSLPADAISLTVGDGVLYVSAKDARLYALVDAP